MCLGRQPAQGGKRTRPLSKQGWDSIGPAERGPGAGGPTAGRHRKASAFRDY